MEMSIRPPDVESGLARRQVLYLAPVPVVPSKLVLTLPPVAVQVAERIWSSVTPFTVTTDPDVVPLGTKSRLSRTWRVPPKYPATDATSEAIAVPIESCVKRVMSERGRNYQAGVGGVEALFCTMQKGLSMMTATRQNAVAKESKLSSSMFFSPIS